MELQEILHYALMVMPYAFAVVLAIGSLVLLVGMYRSPLVTVAAVLLLTLWKASVGILPTIRLGLALSPLDFLFAGIALVLLLRLVLVPRGTFRLPWPLLALTFLLALSFGIGTLRFGTAAGVDFRESFYFWSLCLYLMTFRPEPGWIDRVLDAWLLAAFALCLVVWYRWAALALGFDWFDPFWRYGESGAAFRRVVTSTDAVFLAFAALISVASIAAGSANPVHYVLLPALLLTIVLLQHRSVWVATFLSLLLLLLLLRRQDRKRSGGTLIAALASIAIVGAVLASGVLGTATESVTDQAVRATSTTEGTFVWRADGWRELVRRWAGLGPIGLMIGEPFGSGYERHLGNTWGGSTVNVGAHNYFVTLLLRTGLLGLLAFMLILWTFAKIGMKDSGLGPPRYGPPMVLAAVICLVLYCIPYAPTAQSAVLFGVSLCLAQRALERRASITVTSAAAEKETASPIHPKRGLGDLPLQLPGSGSLR